MSITVQEFIIKLENVRRQIAENDSVLRLAAYTALGEQSERIFTYGELGDGQKYSYSTQPIYVSKKSAFDGAKLGKPVGKTGKTVFASSGRSHTSVYLPGGYKQYRSEIGRESSFVNLELSGDLRSDFENPQGGVPTPIQVNEHEYIVTLKRPVNIKKKEGLTKKYGDFFKLTEAEKKLFFETAEFELQKLLTP